MNKFINDVYLAGPMRGIPDFNFPAFFRAAHNLELRGYTVFNPAKRDIDVYGTQVSQSTTGDLSDIQCVGFSLREALGADLAYICVKAEAIALLPGWENSKGVAAELATAQALGLVEIYLNDHGEIV